jgi:hypothetical protein
MSRRNILPLRRPQRAARVPHRRGPASIALAPRARFCFS